MNPENLGCFMLFPGFPGSVTEVEKLVAKIELRLNLGVQN